MVHSEILRSARRNSGKKVSLKLLNDGADKEYGNLTELASRICGVKNALITLESSNSNWIGTVYHLALKNLPKEYSFSEYVTNLENDLLIVPDIREDPRFTDAVFKPDYTSTRFFASIPLKTEEGISLGMFCLMDDEPRKLNPHQEDAIRTIARQVERLFELRKTTFKLKSHEEHYQRIVERSPNIVYRYSKKNGKSYHSLRVVDILGYTPRQLQADPELWYDKIHPADLPVVDLALSDTKYGNPIDLTYRIRTAGGEWRWLHDRSVNIMDEHGDICIEGIATDITQQKQTEDKLIAQKNYIESVMSAIPDLLFVISIEGVILEVKAGNRDDLLMPEEQVTGKHLSEALPDDLASQFHSAIQDVAEGNSVSNLEYELEIRGEQKIFEARVSPFGRDKAIVLVRNVTLQKEIFEKLRLSEEAFRGNFENAAVGMALVDPDGNWLKVNKSLCKMLGYSEQELVKLTFQEITHPDDRGKDFELVNKILNGAWTYYHLEKRYLHKDGSEIHTILAVSTVEDAAGKILYYISQVIDITALKLAERELADALSKNQAILDSSTDTAIIGTDLEGIIHTFNSGAENLTGYGTKDVIFKETPVLFHKENELAARSKEIFGRGDKTLKKFEILTADIGQKDSNIREWTYIRKDGTQFPVQVSVSPIKTGEKVTGFLMMATDISSIKKSEYELKQLVDLTQSHNDKLKNFAGIVSHNLRNHAGNIDGLLNLLADEDPQLEDLKYFPYLKQASDNLITTIRNLSDITHLNEVDHKKLESVNLNTYIKNAIQNVSAQARKESVEIIHQSDKTEMVSCVPAYLDSIILNFITNSIKYRSKNRDSFVKLLSYPEGDYTVLEIEDNGLGIDMEKHGEKLFGQYNTFHEHPDSRGIGLFITKNQVNAVGGKIEVESKVGVGTTFKIYFKREMR